MAKKTAEIELNRKITCAIKGSKAGLDRIEVPTHEWFYSHSTKDIFHYISGVFEAHP